MIRINHLWGYLLLLLVPDALTGSILIADACGKPDLQAPKITISATGMDPEDTLVLFYKGRFYLNMVDFQDNICRPLAQKGNQFSFRIPERSDGYFYIARKLKTGGVGSYEPISPPYYYFEPGDRIEIAVQRKNEYDYRFNFRGKGAGKYNLKNLLVKAMLGEPSASSPERNANDLFLNDAARRKNKRALQTLEAKRNTISDRLYQKFKVGVQFDNSAESYYALSAWYTKNDLHHRQQSRERFARELDQYYSQVEQIDADPHLLAQSPEYIDYLFYKAKMYSYLPGGRADLQRMYDDIHQHYDGEVRDKLLTRLYLEPKLPQSVRAGYLPFLRSLGFNDLSYSLRRISGRYSRDVITDFPLTDSSGQKVALSAYRGKTVVLDFWFTGCGACAFLYKGVLRPLEVKYLKDPNVVLVSICVDRSRATWMRSLYSQQYSSTDGVVNLYTGGIGEEHPLLKQYGINSFPMLAVVDSGGRIVRIDDADLYELPGLQAAIAQISLSL